VDGAERAGFLAAVARSEHGEEDGLGTLWEYTTKLVGHPPPHSIRSGSEAMPVRLQDAVLPAAGVRNRGGVGL
jgi:hypothetical protein